MTTTEMKPKRQLIRVIDLNKCIGCQTCTVACKKLWTKGKGEDYMYWANVETRPGAGYPRDWEKLGGGYRDGDLQAGELPTQAAYGLPWEFDIKRRVLDGNPMRVFPNPNPTWGPNWDEDLGKGEYPNNYYFYLPRVCNNCEKPACVDACPSMAIYRRKEDGIVMVDMERCDGKQTCVMGCPYKKVYYNFPMMKASKCISCYPRVEKGEAPACAAQCIGRAQFVGFRGDANAAAWKLVDRWKVALPLHPEFGTEPNVFYVPPFSPPVEDGMGVAGKPRIPDAELEKLFGPGVKAALATLKAEREKRSKGMASELMDVLIAYREKDLFALGM
ncbi:MAG: 4Fe-4S dicluster domain-containing protein [Thermoanaerobaculia bacterium]